jgi:hypothetical protein
MLNPPITKQFALKSYRPHKIKTIYLSADFYSILAFSQEPDTNLSMSDPDLFNTRDPGLVLHPDIFYLGIEGWDKASRMIVHQLYQHGENIT